MQTQLFSNWSISDLKRVSFRYTAKGSSIYICVRAKSLQLCLTLCNTMDRGPPGSPGHGVFQARTVKWVAIPSSRGIFPTQGPNPHLPHLLHWQAGSLSLGPLGSRYTATRTDSFPDSFPMEVITEYGVSSLRYAGGPC